MPAGQLGASAVAPPCNNYLSNVKDPPNIGVAITDANGNIFDVIYVDFKSYVKDVLPNEWWPPDWQMAAYQAGAMAVRNYGWYFVNHWDGDIFLPTGECWHVRDDTFDQVYVQGSGSPGSPNARPHASSTAEAVDSTWAASRMTRGGAIFAGFHKAGCPVDTPGIFVGCSGRVDQCGQWYLGAAPGNDMSQYGSESCAEQGYVWNAIVRAYYKYTAQAPTHVTVLDDAPGATSFYQAGEGHRLHVYAVARDGTLYQNV